MASTYLSRTISSSTGKKFTLSMWVKRTKISNDHMLFHLSSDGGTANYLDFALKDNDKLDVQLRNGSSTTYYRKRTNQLFRDTNAWYHLVWRFDSTNSTADDRWILYVNGERVTSIDVDGTPSQVSSDYVTPLNRNGATLQIGNSITGSMYFDGIISHVHLCDGYSYAPTEFGETDANGVWKIKTSPSVTYGTNGFFILKDGNSVTDQSGNGNNFTVGGGTLTNTEDCPSNVFATMNPLDNYWQNSTFTNGNNTFVTVASNENYNTSTLAMPSNDAGKYYCEVKVDSASAYTVLGIAGKLTTSATSNFKNHSDGYAYDGGTGNIINNNIGSSYGDTYTTNDIIGIAVDTDNNKLYFSKNGVWQNSGVPTSGATGTGAISITTDTTNGYYMFAGGTRHNDSAQLSWNFGNGYFGTTAVASAGTNASGNGIFEYDVPTGYTALSTKGLNS